jgi:hypothetical protein
MRRLLRDVANNRQLGDTTTLADPTVVDEISKRASGEIWMARRITGPLAGGRATARRR